MTLDLFESSHPHPRPTEQIGPGAFVLHAFATPRAAELIDALDAVLLQAPFRFMTTPGGYRMSVAMTNCGRWGWLTDRTGYRYSEIDPATRLPWPVMPAAFLKLAAEAAAIAGFAAFVPDACLINRYEPGARLSLHQDKNEKDFAAPIVSVSLGLPAVFVFGGARRNDPTMPVSLAHGDVVVWGGPARLRYHGVRSLKDGEHRRLGRQRINLTFRRAQA